MRASFGFLSLFVLTACASSERVASTSTSGPGKTPATASSTPAPSSTREAPMLVHVTGPDQVSGLNEVTLKVSLDRGTRDPVDLKIVLPPGTELVSGVAQEHITEVAELTERTLVVRLPNGIPTDDV